MTPTVENKRFGGFSFTFKHKAKHSWHAAETFKMIGFKYKEKI